MAETLINLNQNRLNTETGSFTELIKSTQAGKEAITTALVNKGINATSDETLTSMATSINSLIVSDLQVHTGGISKQQPMNSDSCILSASGLYVSNQYGDFVIYIDNYTNLYITNLTKSYYDAAPSTSSNSISNYIFSSSLQGTIATQSTPYNGGRPYWASEDGTELWYFNSGDRQTIYKYTIDYSAIPSLYPNSISVSLSRTLSLTNPFSSDGTERVTLLYVDTTNKRILVRRTYDYGDTNIAFNNGDTYVNYQLDQLYYISYTNTSGDETGLTATKFTNENTMPSGTFNSGLCPLFIKGDESHSDKLLIRDKGGSSNHYSYLISMNWTTPSLKYIGIIEEDLLIYEYKTINNRPCIINIKNASDGTIEKEILSIYYLDIDTSQNILQIIKPQSFEKYIFNECLSRVQTSFVPQTQEFRQLTVIPTFNNVNNKIYIGGLVLGSYWIMTINNNSITVEGVEPLLRYCNQSDYYNSYYYRSGCFYNPTTKVQLIVTSSSYYNFELADNQFVGLTFTASDGKLISFTPTPFASFISGTLPMSNPEVLVEDN